MNGATVSPKLLCITSDRRLSQLIDKTMVSRQGSQVCHVAAVNEGMSYLHRGSFDVVLLDSEAAEDDVAVVAELQDACQQTPLMIASGREPTSLSQLSDDVAVVPKSDLDEQRLALEVLRMLAARESQLQEAMRTNLDRLLGGQSAAGSNTPTDAPLPDYQACDLNARLIPVRHGLPQNASGSRLTGISESHLRLQRSTQNGVDTELFVVGLEQQGRRRFEYCQAIHHEDRETHLLRLGIDRLFPPDQCNPRLQDHHVRVGLKTEIAEAWQAIGVLRAEPVDRILVCPRCSAIPSLRPGCRSCGAPWVDSEPMIHHFPCASVAPADDFVYEGRLRCPKCLADHLVLGADCEHLPGPVQCRQCHWQDTQREMYGRCFGCSHVFPTAAAAEQEVIRYDVDRLEPLGLFTTS